MTTIYVNHALGVVMTDTRTTTAYGFKLFGFLFNKKYKFNDNGIKAINVHDRIFVESGSCQESTKILQYLTQGTPIVPEHKKYNLISSCFLVDKNWLLHIYIQNGEVHKKFVILKSDAWYCAGSGADALKNALARYNFKPTMDEAITAFKTVHFSDRYTNSHVRIYNI